MNTRDKAFRAILEFLNSGEKVLVLTGTHQYQKHVLALLTVLTQYRAPATILFRSNGAENTEQFLAPIVEFKTLPKPGKAINIAGEYKLFLDTINTRSWKSTPSDIDVAIIYPIDSLDVNEGDRCVRDLLERKAKKIILVSWTDNKDFSWTSQFKPTKAIYDSEEEDPEYHKRVLEITEEVNRNEIKGLPKYAQSTPTEYLVQIWCDRCQSGRWAKLNKLYPGQTGLRNAEYGVYLAICLKCGYEATDNYNWYR